MNELMTKATLAREAAPLIASCSAEAKNDALMRIADALIAHTDEIAEANRADVLRALSRQARRQKAAVFPCFAVDDGAVFNNGRADGCRSDVNSQTFHKIGSFRGILLSL